MQQKAASSFWRAALLSCGLTAAHPLFLGTTAANPPFERRVLMLSIDGLHALDMANYIQANPNSTLASLSRNAISYTSAYTVKPSDSFPTFLATITGGSPISTGVWYDDSYDRSLWPPGVTSGPTGTAILFNEVIDLDWTAIDGGGGINPDLLPRDPARGGAIVYPHDFLRVNTIFEVVKGAGGRTALCEKHLSYEIAHGPSGEGVDDLYTPEIASNNQFGVSMTKSVGATEAYDDLKVQAILNQVNGRDHTGDSIAGVPTLFGMNFQAVSVAQRLRQNLSISGSPMPGPGGYVDSAGTPSAYLSDALSHTDASIGLIVTNLQSRGLLDSTYIVVLGKHGNAPMDPSRLLIANGDPTNPAADLAFLIDPSIVTVAKITADDVALFWLDDQSKAETAAAVLRDNQGQALAQDVFAGESLKLLWNDPLIDPRTPDIVLFPRPGVIYTTSTKKLAEHGGASEDDTHVALLVANPSFQPQTNKTPVVTTQIAPTILQLLGLNPLSLQAVVQERTPLLPGFEPMQAAINSPFRPSTISFTPASVLHLNNRQAQFQLTDIQKLNYVVQASSGLTNWVSISTNNLVVSGSATLTDAQANRFTNRFYRALLTP
jgi:Type I phosphodiesterase / nucleotide pyrophosphatase